MFLGHRELTGILEVEIWSQGDLFEARREIKRLAATLPFVPLDLERIEIAVMELGSNLLKHAGHGRIFAEVVAQGVSRGIRIQAADVGPGIGDLDLAMKSGYSTTGTFGTGLPAVRDLMDRFEIRSEPGRGTTVTVEKWPA